MGKKFDRVKLNKYIDIVMMLVFIPVLLSSIALYILPSGPASGLTEFLSINKSAWQNIHAVSGWLLIVLMLAHLVLHCQIIKVWAKLK